MPKETKLPALKNIPPKTDRELKIALDAIKESLEVRLGRRGDPLDRAVTLRELEDSGIVKVRNKAVGADAGITPPDDGGPGDITTPPAPSGLEASGAFTSIVLTWNKATYGNHAYTEIWRSQDNALGGATLLSTTNAFIYTDEVGYNKTYYYWVRFVSIADIVSPYNDTEGTSAATEVDVGAVMAALSEELSALPGFSTLNTTIPITLGSTTANLQATIATVNSAAASAQADVNSLTTGTPRVLRATSSPTQRSDGTSLQAGDLWMDTDNGNEIFVYTGSTWAASTAGSTSSSDTTLQTQITANGNSISQNASDLLLVAGVSDRGDISTSVNITSLNSSITNGTTGLAANASAIGALTTRVTAAEGTITSQATDITALESTLSGYSGTSTVATAVSGLNTRVTTNEGAITSQSGSITSLTNTVNAKTQTFVQSSAPTAVATGDLWIDTSSNNKLMRWSGSAWVAVNDTSGITVFAQDAEPTGVNVGDLWFETDDNNQQHRYNGSAWVAVDDSRIASNATAVSNLSTAVGLSGSSSTKITDLESTVNHASTGVAATSTAVGLLQTAVSNNDGDITSINGSITSLTNVVNAKTQTFVSSSAPTAISVGDLWIKTSEDNKLYRATAAGNSNWVAVNDTSGITVHAQSSQPTGAQEGDLWFDTGNDNQQYRWSGSAWVLLADDRVAANATAVSNLSTAVGLSGSSSTKIDNLETTVNHGTTGVAATANAVSQLNTTVTAIPVNFSQATAPSSGLTTGDLWVDTDDKQLYRWDGSAWQSIRDSLTTSHASLITALRTDVDGNAADITTNQTAISNEASARASAITGVNASIATKNKTFIQSSAPTATAIGDLWIDTGNNKQLKRASATGSSNWVAVRDTTNDNYPRVFTQNAQPTAINTGDIWFDTDSTPANKQYRWDGSNWVEVRDVTTNASVTTLSSAVTDIEGNAAASYVLQVNANGAVAGMVIESNASGSGTGTAIQFQADKFAIWDGSGAAGSNSVAPFIVDSGVVYIDTARIKNGSIEAAKIGSLNADVITTGGMNADRITSGTIDANRIDASFIQSTDLSTGGSTNINGANITTGTINAARIDASFIQSSDLTSTGSTTIDGSRITTGLINADRINVTDLVLPTVNKKVSGATIGGFTNNDMRLAQVGEIGTEPGIYQGYVRVFGGNGQVKTLSIAAGDGTYSASGSGTQLSGADDAYNNAPTTSTLPISDTGGLQYHSNRAEAWAGIARFQTTEAIAQISVTFIKRSANSVPTHLYIHAQGDGGTRYLDNVEYSFQRLALNQPNDFTFTDVTGASTSTVYTSNAITLSGSGFSGGTATLTGSGATFRVNSGSYVTGSQSVANGDTINVRVTSSGSAGTAVSGTITVSGVSDTYTVTTAGGGSPPGGGGGPLGPPGGGEDP